MAQATSLHGIAGWAGVGLWLGLLALPVSASLLPLTDVVQVAAGESHTCALTQAGVVKCWGRNHAGQLGDGSTVDRLLPVDVVGLEGGVQAVSVGNDHSCALTDAGAVKCWGDNEFGQLGDDSTIDRHTPVQVSGLDSGVQAISAGERAFTCALRSTGAVLCWGINDLGSLGNGSFAHSSVPTGVFGLSFGVRAISAGNAHACAILTATNGLKCWGYGAAGQLGDGSSPTGQPSPVDVTGLGSGVATVAAGTLHTCATLAGTGAARCWGNNFLGQLGDGTRTNRPVPGEVSGLSSGVLEFAAGHYHTCARMSDATLRCWGDNTLGQLGIGVESYGQLTAANVLGLGSGATGIAAGRSYVCAIVAGGALKCWGSNFNGQLGNGSVALPMSGRAPTDVVGLSSGVVALAAGVEHTCALMATGAVRCWGGNISGQLGDGSSVRRFSPVTVTGLPAGIQTIGAGADHTCALAGGAVRCWGSNQYAQLGAPGNLGPHPPVSVNLSGTTAMISAGHMHTCAVNTAGRVTCWGISPFGHNGAPVTLADLFSGIQSVAAGGDHSCALTSGGAVRCWGSNSAGQFGYFGDDSPYETVAISGLSPGVQRLNAGGAHTCMLSASGRVECWGSNQEGQGGSPGPVGYLGLGSGVQSLATGDSHNCVVIGGAVKCWGSNDWGQLGNGGTSTSFVPVDVVGLGSGMQAVSAGAFHTCALSVAGGVKCWGGNPRGQMGDGQFPGVALPQPVLVDPAFFRSGFEAGEGG